MTDRLYNEMRRFFYTTPSSYLDLLKLYLQLLDKKQQQIIRGRDRISCGLFVSASLLIFSNYLIPQLCSNGIVIQAFWW